MEKLLADGNLSQSAKLIGVRLALHHNSQNGRCFPTVETLMDGTTNSRATVHRGLKALRKAGYIDWKTGNSKWSNSYVIKTEGVQNPSSKPPKVATSGQASHLRLATSDGMPVPEVKPGGEGSTVSPVTPSTVSPVTPQLLKSNPGKGYDEGREKEERATAPDSLATPFHPYGRQGAQDSADRRQPDLVSQPTGRKLSFHDIATPEWIERELNWARVQFQDDNDFIIPTSKGFKRIAIEKGWRLPEDKWHEVWMSYSISEAHKRPSAPRPKNAAAI